MTDQTATALAELDELFAGFTDEDLDSVAGWARNPGVALRELPLAMRRPVERYRELELERTELEAEAALDTEQAGRLERLEAGLGEHPLARSHDDAPPVEARADDSAGANVRRLTATELIAVLENDTDTYAQAGEVNVPAAAEELTKRADAEAVDGALEAGQPWSGDDVLEAHCYVEAKRAEHRAEHRGDQRDEDPAEAARRFRAEANTYARERSAIGRIVATYHDRRRRLEALEVKDTRDAREAKLKLEFGEAVEALELIESVLEGGA